MKFEKVLYEDDVMVVGIEALRIGGITIKLKAENCSVHVRDGGKMRVGGVQLRPSLNVIPGDQTTFSLASIAGMAHIKATANHEPKL